MVMHVRHALQGYPESGRLWSNKINKILQNLGYTAINNKPCLYSKTPSDIIVIFMLRQTDDFLISAPTENTADIELNLIQKQLTN